MSSRVGPSYVNAVASQSPQQIVQVPLLAQLGVQRRWIAVLTQKTLGVRARLFAAEALLATIGNWLPTAQPGVRMARSRADSQYSSTSWTAARAQPAGE